MYCTISFKQALLRMLSPTQTAFSFGAVKLTIPKRKSTQKYSVTRVARVGRQTRRNTSRRGNVENTLIRGKAGARPYLRERRGAVWRRPLEKRPLGLAGEMSEHTAQQHTSYVQSLTEYNNERCYHKPIVVTLLSVETCVGKYFP